MHFLLNALYLSAAIKWGDWRSWRDYYPTILFFILGDLLKNFLFYNYWIWTYQETIFGQNILQNHTFISLMVMVILYPSTILVFLGRFPEKRWQKGIWVALWIFIYSFVEYFILYKLDLIHYHHGWSIWWSIVFNCVMFPMFRIHFKQPLLAWGLSCIWILFLWNLFDVPIEKLK